MAKIMDPVLPILSILGYRAISLGSFGAPGSPLLRTPDGEAKMYGRPNTGPEEP